MRFPVAWKIALASAVPTSTATKTLSIFMPRLVAVISTTWATSLWSRRGAKPPLHLQ